MLQLNFDGTKYACLLTSVEKPRGGLTQFERFHCVEMVMNPTPDVSTIAQTSSQNTEAGRCEVTKLAIQLCYADTPVFVRQPHTFTELLVLALPKTKALYFQSAFGDTGLVPLRTFVEITRAAGNRGIRAGHRYIHAHFSLSVQHSTVQPTWPRYLHALCRSRH